MKNFIFTTILFTLLFLGACSEYNSNPDIRYNRGLHNIQTALPWLTADQIISLYDTTNIVGICQLDLHYAHQIDQESGQSLDPWTMTGVTFGIDYSRIPQDSTLGTVWVNGSNAGINEEYRGTFNLPIHLDSNNSVNTFLKNADNWIGAFDTSITFLPKVSINNLQWGQQVSRANNLQLLFGGGMGGYVTCMFDVLDNNTSSHTLSLNFENSNGNVTIPSSEFNNLPSGKCNLTVFKYDPKFITSTNGKRLCVLAVSKHTLGINLTN